MQNGREVSSRVYAGGLAAAIESASEKIYTGVEIMPDYPTGRVVTLGS